MFMFKNSTGILAPEMDAGVMSQRQYGNAALIIEFSAKYREHTVLILAGITVCVNIPFQTT